MELFWTNPFQSFLAPIQAPIAITSTWFWMYYFWYYWCITCYWHSAIDNLYRCLWLLCEVVTWSCTCSWTPLPDFLSLSISSSPAYSTTNSTSSTKDSILGWQRKLTGSLAPTREASKTLRLHHQKLCKMVERADGFINLCMQPASLDTLPLWSWCYMDWSGVIRCWTRTTWEWFPRYSGSVLLRLVCLSPHPGDSGESSCEFSSYCEQ